MATTSSAPTALRLPAFLLFVFAFYWSVPLMAVMGPLVGVWYNFAKWKGPRQDVYDWSRFMSKLFRVKYFKLGSQSLHKTGSVVYLCNHRSWADFFIDVYLTEGRAALMSRWLVFFVFPIFMTAVNVLKGIVLFKRGEIKDKQKFNEWLDRKLRTAPGASLLVFPEGHRSTKPTSLPLKRGMLHYAHSRGLPIQLVISRGKENVMSEKEVSGRVGALVAVAYSQLLPTTGTEFEEFVKQLQATWDKLWAELHAADFLKLAPLVHDEVPQYDYSQEIRLQTFFISIFSIVALLAVLALTYKAVLAITGIAGLVVQKVLLGGLAAWLVASLVEAST